MINYYETDAAALSVSEAEIARYLGYRRARPEDAVMQKIRLCIRNLKKESRPKSVWEVFPVSIEGEKISVASLHFSSHNLARNLRGCDRAALMGATIGPGVDFLIRRAETQSITEAAIYQAAGAAMVEAWCDLVNRRINSQMEEKKYYPRPRFSPGYGDVPLSLQKDFASVLNLPKNCGISLTDTCLMVPSKSVTAFIGFSTLKEPCILAGCESCSSAGTCAFRR